MKYTEIKKTIRLFSRTLKVSFSLSYHSSPLIFLLRILFMVISSLVPIINLYAGKNIIDNIVDYHQEELRIWLFILIATQISMIALSKVIDYLSNIHAERITLLVTKNIINKVNEIDISYFDHPKLYDEIENVTRDINTIPNFVWLLLSMAQIIVQFVISFTVLSQFGIAIPFIIVICCLPNFIIDKKYALKMYEWTRSSMNEKRRMNYSYYTLIGKEFSKDIRINQLFNYLKEKYCIQWENWFYGKKKIMTKWFFATFFTIFLPNIAAYGFVAYLIYSIVNHKATIGDFSYYSGVVSQLITYTFSAIGNASEMMKQKVQIEYYDHFIKWKSYVKINHNGKSLNRFECLEFRDVCFCYPNTENYVLENVSFQINAGERIALIGKNGSGKTTLVKLILRLYEPTSGEILVNGINIKEYNTNEYCQMFSAMLQDYINYAFQLRENLKCADINSEYSDERAIEACKLADIYSCVEQWGQGIDTYLTKQFDRNGVELSGGQWQKLALARLFYKKAQFYILDEPSASLDLESEDFVFKTVFEHAKDKTMLLISHRMNSIFAMDQIIVLDHGRISEIGNHSELMKNKGIYYELYNINVKNYVAQEEIS